MASNDEYDHVMITASCTLESIPMGEWTLSSKCKYRVVQYDNRYWLIDEGRKVFKDDSLPNGFPNFYMAVGYAMGKGWL